MLHFTQLFLKGISCQSVIVARESQKLVICFIKTEMVSMHLGTIKSSQCLEGGQLREVLELKILST